MMVEAFCTPEAMIYTPPIATGVSQRQKKNRNTRSTSFLPFLLYERMNAAAGMR